MVHDGTVTPYEGDLDEYRVLLADRARPTPKNDPTNRRSDRRERADARAATAPLRKKVKDAEARIAKLAAERALLEKALANPGIYAPARKAEVVATQAKLTAIKRLEHVAEAEWIAAEEALEAATA
jgi:ATP-binding cassette subfamily F protein 3